MVQGKNFENLALNYLKPYFTQKIETDKNTIELFNSNVQEKLSQKKPVLKQKAGGSKPFNCPQCKVTASAVGDLRMHLKSSHTILDEQSDIISVTLTLIVKWIWTNIAE